MKDDITIDFVIMWVDDSDANWQKEKSKYQIKRNADGSIIRYRDWELLRYWFRGVEKFAPWVHKIHFVTWGHVPKWLNKKHPKINIVNHKDFIPKKYLPTFSANSIENNLHRIKGLSEHFVFFNDDFYLLSKTKKTDFFKNGIPLDTVALNVHCPKKSKLGQYFCFNDVSVINEYFDFHTSLRNNWYKWLSLKNGRGLFRTLLLYHCPRFPGFWQHHLASSYIKKTFETVWKKEYKLLDETCLHKFRESTDVNQWLFREWQIASGNFRVRSIRFGKSFYIDRDGLSSIKKEMLNYIKKQKGKMIAINDGMMQDQEFVQLKKDLKEVFQTILPEKSSFEVENEK